MKDQAKSGFDFLLKLAREEHYRTMLFGSSDNYDYTLYPRMEILYKLIGDG